MCQAEHFHNLADLAQGIARELSPGVTTRILPGEQAILSIATIVRNGAGTLHSDLVGPCGVPLDRSAVRIRGGAETHVTKGDFWRTPGGVPHTMRAGPDGCQALDIFLPPREAYRTTGSGFA